MYFHKYTHAQLSSVHKARYLCKRNVPGEGPGPRDGEERTRTGMGTGKLTWAGMGKGTQDRDVDRAGTEMYGRHLYLAKYGSTG